MPSLFVRQSIGWVDSSVDLLHVKEAYLSIVFLENHDDSVDKLVRLADIVDPQDACESVSRL